MGPAQWAFQLSAHVLLTQGDTALAPPSSISIPGSSVEVCWSSACLAWTLELCLCNRTYATMPPMTSRTPPAALPHTIMIVVPLHSSPSAVARGRLTSSKVPSHNNTQGRYEHCIFYASMYHMAGLCVRLQRPSSDTQHQTGVSGVGKVQCKTALDRLVVRVAGASPTNSCEWEWPLNASTFTFSIVKAYAYTTRSGTGPSRSSRALGPRLVTRSRCECMHARSGWTGVLAELCQGNHHTRTGC